MDSKTVTLTDKQIDLLKSLLIREIVRYEESHPQHTHFVSDVFNVLANANTEVQS